MGSHHRYISKELGRNSTEVRKSDAAGHAKVEPTVFEFYFDNDILIPELAIIRSVRDAYDE